MASDDSIPKYKCGLCGNTVMMGGGRWDGKYIKAWDLVACNGCRSANHDGIVPGTYPALHRHLEAKGITPQLNQSGWIVWPE